MCGPNEAYTCNVNIALTDLKPEACFNFPEAGITGYTTTYNFNIFKCVFGF